MARQIQKTLYLTENISESDGTGDIEVPPPMLLLSIPVEYTGQVILHYIHGKLAKADKNWRESHKPIPLSNRGFQRHP